MALLTNALSSLIDTGNDAQNNLYKISFEGGNLTDTGEFLTIRCKGFTPPMPSQDSYTVHYITAYIDRPVTKINLDRSFELEFRVDDYWEVYKLLCSQQNITMNAAKSFVATDLEQIWPSLFNVYVDRVDELVQGEDSKEERLFNYKHCWIESITPSQLSTSGFEPITVKCKINFFEMEDWQSGLTLQNANESDHKDSMVETTKNHTNYV